MLCISGLQDSCFHLFVITLFKCRHTSCAKLEKVSNQPMSYFWIEDNTQHCRSCPFCNYHESRHNRVQLPVFSHISMYDSVKEGWLVLSHHSISHFVLFLLMCLAFRRVKTTMCVLWWTSPPAYCHLSARSSFIRRSHVSTLTRSLTSFPPTDAVFNWPNWKNVC